MFTLSKSCYQAILLKQRCNYLNQRWAVYQTAREKCVPSTRNWNYVIFREPVRPLRQLHFTRNFFLTVNISAEQLLPLSNQFNTTVTFSEQLLLQSSYFLGTATFSEDSLLLSSYFFQKATYSDRNIYKPATSC